MTNKSKNINMFLMDGDVTGVIKCTLSNWTGIVYKIPKTKLISDNIKNRDHLKQSGIYFLLGKDDASGEDIVYIGQAGIRKNGEGLLLRILEHTRNKYNEYFNEVIILTTQNNSFGPTEISYLENKFTNLAKESGRYIVRNGNEPNIGNVTEEKESELNEVIENTKLVIGTLGHKIFLSLAPEKLNNKANEEINKELELFLTNKDKTINAKCIRTNEGFVVLKESMIAMEDANSNNESIKKLRKELIKKEEIVDGVLKKTMLFNSASYASGFVIGRSTNGRTYWKDITGKTLKEIEEEENNIEL